MTLNRVIREIKKVVSSHRMVYSYYMGELHEWVDFKGLVYPSCLLVLRSARLGNRQTQYGFSLYLADLVNEDGGNRLEVQSDMMQVLGDILSLMTKNEELDWDIYLEGATVEFFDDEKGNDTPDRVAGVRCDFTLACAFIMDSCQVPVRRAVLHEQGFTIFTEEGVRIDGEDKKDVTVQGEEGAFDLVNEETNETVIKE